MFKIIMRLVKGDDNAAKLVKEGAGLVDVRTIGRIPGRLHKRFRNTPLDNIRREITSLKQLTKPIVTVCRSGNRSEMAKSILRAVGVEANTGGAWINLKKIRSYESDITGMELDEGI